MKTFLNSWGKESRKFLEKVKYLLKNLENSRDKMKYLDNSWEKRNIYKKS